MRVAWKTRTADPAVASTRYRVLSPLAELARRGHSVELFAESRRDTYDVVVFSKAYRQPDQALATALRGNGRRVILDLCDNHFYNPRRLPAYVEARADLLRMIELCSDVVCSTPALARVVMREAGLAASPAVVGDAFEDLGVMQNGTPAPWTEPPKLLWFGLHGSPNAPSGMTDLLLIAGPLKRTYDSKEFELVVVSNKASKFERHIAPLPFPTRYVEWDADAFRRELHDARAVLLPLSDNPFVACKTHNRLSLALAAGVPVIADSIESYREFAPFCILDDWVEGLDEALRRPEAARRRAAGARGYLEARCSAAAVAMQWEAALGLDAVSQVPRA